MRNSLNGVNKTVVVVALMICVTFLILGLAGLFVMNGQSNDTAKVTQERIDESRLREQLNESKKLSEQKELACMAAGKAYDWFSGKCN